MSRKKRKQWVPAKASRDRRREQERERQRQRNNGINPTQQPPAPAPLPPPPPPPIRPPPVELPSDLRDIVPDGVRGGFRWETYGQIVHSIEQGHPENKITRIYQHILAFPGNKRVLKDLVEGLGTTNADHVACSLAELFDTARDMLDKTVHAKPGVFYTIVVQKKQWSRDINVPNFCRFVTSLVFGRNLYKDLVHEVDQRRFCDNPLASAIDRFVAAFKDYYFVPTPQCEEDEDLFFVRKRRAREKYYQYFHGTQSWTEGLLDCSVSRKKGSSAYNDYYESVYAASNYDWQPIPTIPQTEAYKHEINYDYEDWEASDHELVPDEPRQFDEDADDIEAAEGYA
ncbi:hypothetical protein F5Y18DRAFT_443093 [Xylariaceae sp. FL1019]|nr:hypothetical protein F5Y18DRAFT_443093 [Xylariaceae sp. FL1019]